MQHFNRYKNRSVVRNYTQEQLDWANSNLNNDFLINWKNKNSITDYQNFTKYIDDTESYLPEKIAIINFLKLQDSEPLEILDIGAGVGQFLRLSQLLGHTVSGTDIKPALDYLKEVHEHYSLPMHELEIKPNVEFKLPDTYNLITLARVVFDHDDNNKSVWTTNNWIFLKENIFEYLKPNGKFYIKTNIKHHEFPNESSPIEGAYGERLDGWNSLTYLLQKK